jgi:hypothetical protein
MVEPTHPGLNIRFDMNIIYLRLIILSVVVYVSVNTETLLVINFVNLKIKSIQSFKDVHRSRMYTYIFIRVYLYMYEYTEF